MILSAYCGAKELLPKKTDVMITGRRLEELRMKTLVSLFLCFIGLQKTYDTANLTLLSQVLTRFGVLQHMI